MKSKTLTIFTPTYNRAYILPQLYESLVAQTSKDFVWLIVDDGSTDHTKEIVSQWQQDGKIIIAYYYQTNGGKQRAMNFGFEKASTELFNCVDSDDYMTRTAIEDIIDFWNKHKSDDIAGIISLRGKSESKPLTNSYLPKNQKSIHFFELYEKYGFKGDTNLTYRTDILKEYPYHVFSGEKFIGESVQYLQIDDYYRMLLMNEICVICDYRSDGYTQNVARLLKNNPQGYRYLKGLDYQHSQTIKKKCAEMIKYCCASYMCHDHKGLMLAPAKFMYFLFYLPGLLCYFMFYRKA